MKHILVLALVPILAGSAQAQNCGSRGGVRNNPRVPGMNVPPAVQVPKTPFRYGYGTPLPTPLTFGYGYPIGRPQYPLGLTPMQPFIQPIRYPQNWGTPLAQQPRNPEPLAGSYSFKIPLEKQTPPDNSLVRSDEEKENYVRAAIRRGNDAERKGNFVLARACYENACNYPDVPLVSEAKAALERIKGR